jgi:hypothetical protein
MMFASSFVVIELVHALARTGDPDSEYASSVAAVVGHSTIEWEDPQNAALRSKIALLTRAIEFGDIILSIVAHITYIGVMWWAAGNLWFLAVSDNNLLNL